MKREEFLSIRRELSELVNRLSEALQLSDQALLDEFNLKGLTRHGRIKISDSGRPMNMIKMIKIVRDLTGASLHKCKDRVDGFYDRQKRNDAMILASLTQRDLDINRVYAEYLDGKPGKLEASIIAVYQITGWAHDKAFEHVISIAREREMDNEKETSALEG